MAIGRQAFLAGVTGPNLHAFYFLHKIDPTWYFFNQRIFSSNYNYLITGKLFPFEKAKLEPTKMPALRRALHFVRRILRYFHFLKALL
jgi:hypothetical protein